VREQYADQASGAHAAPWVAVQVRPKMEKTTAQHLAYRGYEYFLPLAPTDAQGGIRAAAALCPGDEFCGCDWGAGASIVSTPGVTRIVSFGEQPAHIDELEIHSIRRAVTSGQAIVSRPSFQQGMEVQITDGPLRGVRGTVIRENGKRYVVVSISLLQRSVAVEFESSLVAA
jgi:hypothetical protein